MNLGLECALDLRDGSREANAGMAVPDACDGESLRFKPAADYGEIVIAEAETAGILGGGEPFAIVGCPGVCCWATSASSSAC
jgi:hypothetical protein